MSHTRDAIVDRLLHEDRRYWAERLSGDVAPATLAPDFPAGHAELAAGSAGARRHSLAVPVDAATGARVLAVCDGRPALVLAALLAGLALTAVLVGAGAPEGVQTSGTALRGLAFAGMGLSCLQGGTARTA